MNAPFVMRTSGISKCLRRLIKLTVLLSTTWCAQHTFAQPVLAPIHADPVSLAGQNGTFPQSGQQTLRATQAIPKSDVRTPLTWGPVTFYPEVIYRYSQVDGLLSEPGHPTNTNIHFYVANILAALGTHWTINYSPSYSVYSNPDFTDAFDHNAELIGQTNHENWGLVFTQGFMRSSQPMVETAQQTQEDIYTTTFNIAYLLSSRLTLDTEISQKLRYAIDYNDIKEWSVFEWLRNQATPQVETALGAGASYTEIYRGPDMAALQAMGKISWHTGKKLDLQLQAGFDHQQFNSSNSAATTNPIYDGTISYRPFEHTVITALAGQAITIAHFATESYKSTQWSLSIGQRVLRFIDLTASTGYRTSTYRPVLSEDETLITREDGSRWYDFRLDAAIIQGLRISLFYHRIDATSSDTSYGFNSKQQGVEISFRY
jgi:hypothetical protein